MSPSSRPVTHNCRIRNRRPLNGLPKSPGKRPCEIRERNRRWSARRQIPDPYRTRPRAAHRQNYSKHAPVCSLRAIGALRKSDVTSVRLESFAEINWFTAHDSQGEAISESQTRTRPFISRKSPATHGCGSAIEFCPGSNHRKSSRTIDRR